MTSIIIVKIILLTSTVYSLREQCCKDLGVPEKCYQPLCNPSKIPRVMLRYKLFDPDINCHPYLLPISRCLSNGRDVSRCCYKKAADDEFDYCFGLCNGTMNFDYAKKNSFLSCFVLNVVTIFPCLTSSYEAAPSNARELEILSTTEDSALLKWKEPLDSPDLVSHYNIHLIERTGITETETILTTEDTEYKLEGLSTSKSYSVHVVALGSENNSDKNWYKSIISNVVLFTTANELIVSKHEIQLPKTTVTYTMFCKMRLIFEAEKAIEWVKITEDDGEVILPENKYSVVSFQSEIDKSTIVSALKILDFEGSDFAKYRCYIKNTRIEYTEIILNEFDYSGQAPNDDPPETLLDCCSKHNHKNECQSVCSHGPDDKRTMLRPGAFLPPPKNCQKEVDNLFKCSVKSLNSAACCIHSKVPFHCLGMCDSRFNIDANRVKTCRKHIKHVYACKMEEMSVKPEAVSGVRTLHLYRHSFRFFWDKSLDAKLYHVYNRKRGGLWTVRVTLDHTVDITDSDEVVLLSVNEFGHSEQHRIYYDADGWLSVDH